MSETHYCMITSSFAADGWRADCVCGWVGPQRPGPTEAHRDFTQHANEARAADTAGPLTHQEKPDE